MAALLKKCDIVVAGGGLVGCALACALAKNTKLAAQKVVLLEGSPRSKFKLTENYSNRVSALNPGTKSLMKSLGVWNHVENMRYQPVKDMQVWDASSDALIAFNHFNFEKDVAYIVENDVLLNAINTELENAQNSNVQVVYNAKIDDYVLPNDEREDCIIKMNNGDSYSCRLLIGADGAASKVRKAMKTPYLSWNYHQMGVVATLELNQVSENFTAWQRFLPTGPVAILPLNSTQSSLVWSTEPNEARELVKLPEEEFVDRLNTALHGQYKRDQFVDSAVNTLSNILSSISLPSGISRQLPPSIKSVLPSSRAAFPLGFGHASRYVADNVALIGDAAHRVHPLAGQGVNLGFGDVDTLVDVLSNAVYSGTDINDKSYLLEYETQRQRHVLPTAIAIDGLQKLYSTDIMPVVLMRSLGLQLTHALNPIKNLIMKQAMA